jgi:hypothetical protein
LPDAAALGIPQSSRPEIRVFCIFCFEQNTILLFLKKKNTKTFVPDAVAKVRGNPV